MHSVGSLIAGYRVERLLGSGGMGAVYLVANPELPRREALKLLSAELSQDEGFRARFLREAEVAARLEHPNIVAIHRRGQTDDGQLWIAMQFIDGTDADAAVKRGQMTPQRAIHILTEVAKALDYAHRHNVIHRDIKPANFLLSGPVGPDERVLLGDFGIARAFDDAGLTGTGQVMATIAYAAPEVVAGDPVDGRTDQYSLGCTLFRMLTGTAPFASSGSQAAVMMAHLSKPPPRLSTVTPGLPPALDAVIARAMSKDPAQRYPTCSDLAAAAKAALQQPIRQVMHPPAQQPVAPAHPAPQPPPPPPQLPQLLQPPQLPPRPRHRAKIIGAVAGVVVLAAAAITAVNWPSGEPDSPAVATPPSTRATATSTATSATVSAAALPAFLLTAEEAGAIMAVPLAADAVRDKFWDDRAAISDADCIGAWAPAQSATYDGTNFTAVRAQIMNQQPAPEHDGAAVAQAVIAFGNQDIARKPFVAQSDVWEACALRTVTINGRQGPQSWTFGRQTYPEAGLYTMTITKAGDSNSCGRALTIRGSVLIDVLACQPGLSSQAVDIAKKIAEKVTNG